MLDSRTDRLLKFIHGNSAEGSFRIFGTDELLQAFSAKQGVDGEGLAMMLDFLCEGRYIAVKYRDSASVCLAPLPKGRIYCEEDINEQKKRLSAALRRIAFNVLSGAVGGMIALWLGRALC